MVARKIYRELLKYLTFILLMITPCKIGLSQQSDIELELLRSFRAKESQNYQSLIKCNNEIETNHLKLSYSVDSSIIAVFSKEFHKDLSLKNLHMPNQRILVYFSQNKKAYFISGFDNLDLASFFEFIDISKEEYEVTKLLFSSFGDNSHSFMEDLRNYNKKNRKQRKRIAKKFKLDDPRPFHGELIH